MSCQPFCEFIANTLLDRLKNWCYFLVGRVGVVRPPFLVLPLTIEPAKPRLCYADGETLHGFRAGCAITLALKAAELSEIMDHVGWTKRHTALYYLQLAKVLHPDGASAKLSSDKETPAVNSWQDINELKHFVCAFPVTNEKTRSNEESF